MFLYSQTINAFLTRLKIRSWEILQNEMGLVCHQSRFEWKKHYIPLHLVVFEDDLKVGFFDHRFFQIGLNKKLIHITNSRTVDNILRHELAHFIAHLKYKDSIQNHGKEYRELCKSYNWGEEVYTASINLENENKNYQDKEFDHIIRKIKKLMNLAAGTSGPEAEAATLKANELLTKYNIQSIETEKEPDDEEVSLLRVYETKRVNAQLNALYEILRFFQVSPVISKGKGISFLEIIGSRHHVELADYMAKFLLSEMEKHYLLFKKENPSLKGAVAKNSYIKGWARGLCIKLSGQRTTIHNSKNALITLDKALTKKMSLVYPRLSSSISRASQFCQQSAAKGASDGLNTSLRKGINQKDTKLITN